MRLIQHGGPGTRLHFFAPVAVSFSCESCLPGPLPVGRIVSGNDCSQRISRNLSLASDNRSMAACLPNCHAQL
jgi:hypothetical protein